MPREYNKKSAPHRDGSVTPTRRLSLSSPTNTDLTSRFNIRLLERGEFYSVLPSLTRLLLSAVKGGASVNFVDPEGRFSEAECEAWWRKQASDFRDGSQLLIAASHSGPNGDDDEVVGEKHSRKRTIFRLI